MLNNNIFCNYPRRNDTRPACRVSEHQHQTRLTTRAREKGLRQKSRTGIPHLEKLCGGICPRKEKTHEKKLCCKCNFEPTGLDN